MSQRQQGPYSPYRSFDGETYGESHGYDDERGEFKRTSQGTIKVMRGPPMVAEHLERVLRTPVGTNTRPDGTPPRGSDPFRPTFGLDHEKLMDNTSDDFVNLRQAIIEAIGPDAIPWVQSLNPGDIDVAFDAANRVSDIIVELVLADGTPLTFDIDFRALLGREAQPEVNVSPGSGEPSDRPVDLPGRGSDDDGLVSPIAAGTTAVVRGDERVTSPLSVGGRLSINGRLSVE